MSASSIEVENPILCSPFAEPGEHWWIEEGRMPERRPGRRPAGYWNRDPKAPEPEAGFTRGVWVPLEHVNLIRERLDSDSTYLRELITAIRQGVEQPAG